MGNIQRKIKKCAGFNGVEHEAIIYKNIAGKKYCKSCAFKLQPPKTIKKVSEKQVIKLKIKENILKKDKFFYQQLWFNRFFLLVKGGSYIRRDGIPKCEICGDKLGDVPNLMFFHHILEKRNYPQYRYVPANVAILCPDCHSSYESNPNNVPFIKEVRQRLIDDRSIIDQRLNLLNNTNVFKADKYKTRIVT